MNGRNWKNPLAKAGATLFCVGVAALFVAEAQAAQPKQGQKRQGGDPLAKLDPKNECPPAVKAEHSAYVDTIQKLCGDKNSLQQQLKTQNKDKFPACVTADYKILGFGQAGANDQQLQGKVKSALELFEKGAQKVGKSIYQPSGNIQRFIDDKFSEEFGSLYASMEDICKRMKLAAKEIGVTCRDFALPKVGEAAKEAECTHLNVDPKIKAIGQAAEFKKLALFDCRSKVQSQNLADGLNRARWDLKDPKDGEGRDDPDRKGAPPKIDEFIKTAEGHYQGFSRNFMSARGKVQQAFEQHGKKMEKDDADKFKARYAVCDKLGGWVATELHNQYINKMIMPLKRLDDVFYTAERDAAREAELLKSHQAVLESRANDIGPDLAGFANQNAVADFNAKTIAKKFGSGFVPMNFKGSQFAAPKGTDGKERNCTAHYNAGTGKVVWACAAS